VELGLTKYRVPVCTKLGGRSYTRELMSLWEEGYTKDGRDAGMELCFWVLLFEWLRARRQTTTEGTIVLVGAHPIHISHSTKNGAVIRGRHRVCGDSPKSSGVMELWRTCQLYLC